MGRKTGIGLRGEASGLIASEEYKEKVFHQDWYLGDTLNAAIGQGFQLVTPLQAAMNDGFLRRLLCSYLGW